MKFKWRSFAVNLAIPLAVGGIAAYLTQDNMVMFDYINKPALSPPQWSFPVAWTILYVLMGIAAFIVCNAHKPKTQKSRALLLYAVQLAINFAWPLVFFNAENFLYALIVIVAMLIFVLLCTLSFFRVDKKAGVLMLPYLLWTAFATYLNYGIYILN